MITTDVILYVIITKHEKKKDEEQKVFFPPTDPKEFFNQMCLDVFICFSFFFLLSDWFFPHKLSLWSSLFQLSSLSFIVHKSKEKPQKFHFASRGLAAASTTSEDGSSINTKEYYLEVGKSQQQQFASSQQQQQRKLDLDYLKAMMNLPPQDLQPYSQLQKMAHVAQNSLVNIILKMVLNIYTYNRS